MGVSVSVLASGSRGNSTIVSTSRTRILVDAGISCRETVKRMPQQRRQKKWQQMLNDLKTGDKVVTSGGLRGTVIALRDDYIQLRVPPDNLRIEVTRASVASVMAPEDKNNKAA